MSQLAEKIWRECQKELYLSMRFLEAAFGRILFEPHKRVRSVATDGEKIYYQETYVYVKYRESSGYLNRCLFHMLLHGVFWHFPDKRQYDGMDEADRQDWNLACDIAVEYLIDGMEVLCVERPLKEVRKEIYTELKKKAKRMNAESIFRYFQTEPLNMAQYRKLSLLFTMDDHELWEFGRKEGEDEEGSKDGDSKDQEDGKKENKEQRERKKQLFYQKREENREKWKDISEKIQTAMETIGGGNENQTGNLLATLRQKNRRRYDYRNFLRKFLVHREIIKTDPDSYDPVFYCYGLKAYGNLPLIEPLEISEVKTLSELAIVIDTSGSCSGTLVKKFLSVTFGILKEQENKRHHMNLHIIQADCEVKEDVRITRQEELSALEENFVIRGHGDTDFRPAFAYINSLCAQGAFRDFKGVVYFTDGYGTFPLKRPAYPVAFVFLEQEGKAVKVPPWAMKVILSEEEI